MQTLFLTIGFLQIENQILSIMVYTIILIKLKNKNLKTTVELRSFSRCNILENIKVIKNPGIK